MSDIYHRYKYVLNTTNTNKATINITQDSNLIQKIKIYNRNN